MNKRLACHLLLMGCAIFVSACLTKRSLAQTAELREQIIHAQPLDKADVVPLNLSNKSKFTTKAETIYHYIYTMDVLDCKQSNSGLCVTDRRNPTSFCALECKLEQITPEYWRIVFPTTYVYVLHIDGVGTGGTIDKKIAKIHEISWK